MEIRVFYRDDCKRCHGIREKIDKLKLLIPDDVSIRYYNLSNRTHKNLALKLGVRRIPAIALYGSIYFIGIPDDEDFVKMVNYVHDHPEHARTDELSD